VQDLRLTLCAGAITQADAFEADHRAEAETFPSCAGCDVRRRRPETWEKTVFGKTTFKVESSQTWQG
jgi:hypothetical protein